MGTSEFNARGNPAMDQDPIKGGVEILLAASCYSNRKPHAFRVNRDQVIDLEIWFKIHTNVSNVETASKKTSKLLKFSISFETITVEFRHSATI